MNIPVFWGQVKSTNFDAIGLANDFSKVFQIDTNDVSSSILNVTVSGAGKCTLGMPATADQMMEQFY